MAQQTQACTVLIPAYNEEGAIGEVLDQLLAIMGASGLTYQVLVVDDGSEDHTAEVAEARGVDVLRQPVNRGYGAAIKAGVRQAEHEVIVITDADGTYPNEEIPRLVGLMDHNDMVVGARTGDEVHIPMVRRPAKWFINTLANHLAGRKIPDLNSGLRVFRKSLALRFYPVLPDGFSLTTTITMAMLADGYPVEYVPISYHKRVGLSKIRPIRDTINFTMLIIRTTVYFAPLRVFLPLAALLFALGAAVGLYSFFVLDRVMDVTTVILMLSALQVGMAGLLADMVDKRTSRF